jgi:hypothetical protein
MRKLTVAYTKLLRGSEEYQSIIFVDDDADYDSIFETFCETRYCHPNDCWDSNDDSYIDDWHIVTDEPTNYVPSDYSSVTGIPIEGGVAKFYIEDKQFLWTQIADKPVLFQIIRNKYMECSVNRYNVTGSQLSVQFKPIMAMEIYE